MSGKTHLLLLRFVARIPRKSEWPPSGVIGARPRVSVSRPFSDFLSFTGMLSIPGSSGLLHSFTRARTGKYFKYAWLQWAVSHVPSTTGWTLLHETVSRSWRDEISHSTTRMWHLNSSLARFPNLRLSQRSVTAGATVAPTPFGEIASLHRPSLCLLSQSTWLGLTSPHSRRPRLVKLYQSSLHLAYSGGSPRVGSCLSFLFLCHLIKSGSAAQRGAVQRSWSKHLLSMHTHIGSASVVVASNRAWISPGLASPRRYANIEEPFRKQWQQNYAAN